MILKNKKTDLYLKLLLAVYSVFLLITPYIAFAYDIPKDKNYPAYGIAEEHWAEPGFQKTCGNVFFILNSIQGGTLSLPPNKILHYENLYNAQCLGLTVSEHTVYERPYDRTAKTADGQFCDEFQEKLITQLFDEKLKEEDLDAQDSANYINQCVVAPAGWIPRNPMDEDRGIPLMAPFPIEGGDYVENTNKTYIFTYMIKLYKFVIGIAGIVAVGELVLAGYGIALAAGDSGKVENSKKRLIQTLEGLGLLFTTAIILNTINPQAYNFDADVKITKSYVADYVYSAGMGNWADTTYRTAPIGDEVITYCTELDDYFGITISPINNNVERLKKLQEIDKNEPGRFFKVKRNPAITKETIAAKITKGPLTEISSAFDNMVQEGEKTNINPMLAVYMWKTESGWGVYDKNSVASKTHNIGNVRPTKEWLANNYPIYDGPPGTFMDFNKQYGAPTSWLKGIPFWFDFIKEVYIDQEFDTVEEIVAKYAPCTETRAGGNNTKKYIFDVRTDLEGS